MTATCYDYRYEIGAVGEYTDESGKGYRLFDWVATTLDERIREICDGAGADNNPILFITGSRRELGSQFIPNFREAKAVSKGYKGTRVNERPFHYDNITAYLRGKYNTKIANGCEADDLICIEQYSRLQQRDSIICTRDKDLRQCPGWHYGWECGRQPEFGPVEYDDFGTISLVKGKSGNKIVGGGKKFFFAQLLTGDVVDNIGGLKGSGPVKSYNLLNGATTEEECRSILIDAYKAAYADNWLQFIREQSDLLWIVKEYNEDGTFKHYSWT